MDKQKMYAIIMVPVVAGALFVAWHSYSATLAPAPKTVDTRGTPGGPPAGMGGGGAARPTPAQMMDTMAKELTLTPDQKTKIAAIQDDVAAKRKAMPQGMDRDERRKKMTEYRTAADTQIKALLNPDQQKKYDEMQEKRRAQMQAMRGGGGGGGGRMGGSGGGMGGPGGGAGSPGGGSGGGGPKLGAPGTAPGG